MLMKRNFKRGYELSVLTIRDVKHDIHIKPKSYKLELLRSWSFNMVLELGLVGGLVFEPPLPI